jgi:hypothetical protein
MFLSKHPNRFFLLAGLRTNTNNRVMAKRAVSKLVQCSALCLIGFVLKEKLRKWLIYMRNLFDAWTKVLSLPEFVVFTLYLGADVFG